MHYIFETEIRYWRGQLIQALPLSRELNFRPHWWFTTPLLQPLPDLTFRLNSKAPKPDNLFVGVGLSLYSERLVALLQQANVTFEAFSCILLDRKTNELLPLNYQAVHLLDAIPGVDSKKSDIDDENNILKKLVLTESCIKSGKYFFRLKERINLIVIHENLKQEFEHIGITGCIYTPVEEYKVGIPPY